MEDILSFPNRPIHWLWILWVGALVVTLIRVWMFALARRSQDRALRETAPQTDSAAVIVSIKGMDAVKTPAFFESLFSQDYPGYRVIITFESWDEPAATWLKEQLDISTENPCWQNPHPQEGPREIHLVCAGLAENEGQKVHNQRAAFRLLTTNDSIIAFADADMDCPNDWLSRLVAPINHGTHEISTTYRWLVPETRTTVNQVASVINASVTTQGGSELTNVLWGGSMAITKGVFLKLELAKLLRGSLNDDLRLSKAARKEGYRIAFVRSLIVSTPVDYSWSSFVEFARRQWTQVRVFSPILFSSSNLLLVLYSVGLLSAVGYVIAGHFAAWLPLVAAALIDQVRAFSRILIGQQQFADAGTRKAIGATAWVEHLLTPFYMLLQTGLAVSTWFKRDLEWGKVRYRIHGKDRTEILSRETAYGMVPTGAASLACIQRYAEFRPESTTYTHTPARTGGELETTELPPTLSSMPGFESSQAREDEPEALEDPAESTVGDDMDAAETSAEVTVSAAAAGAGALAAASILADDLSDEIDAEEVVTRTSRYAPKEATTAEEAGDIAGILADTEDSEEVTIPEHLRREDTTDDLNVSPFATSAENVFQRLQLGERALAGLPEASRARDVKPNRLSGLSYGATYLEHRLAKTRLPAVTGSERRQPQLSPSTEPAAILATASAGADSIGNDTASGAEKPTAETSASVTPLTATRGADMVALHRIKTRVKTSRRFPCYPVALSASTSAVPAPKQIQAKAKKAAPVPGKAGIAFVPRPNKPELSIKGIPSLKKAADQYPMSDLRKRRDRSRFASQGSKREEQQFSAIEKKLRFPLSRGRTQVHPAYRTGNRHH